MAVAGRDYFTVVGMLMQMQLGVVYCDVRTGHLSQVWGWKELLNHECARQMRNLDPAHAFRIYRWSGIYVQ